METLTRPYDLEAEMQVLGALCIEPDQITQCILKTDDFYLEKHQDMYETILKLYFDGIKPDIVSITDKNPSLKETAFEIISKAFMSSNLQYHSKIVRRKAMERFYLKSIEALSQKTSDDDFLVEVEKTLLSFHDMDDRKIFSMQDIILKILEDMEKAKQRGRYGIQTGFQRLNEAIIGLCPKHLILLGGFTGFGKSSFLAQLMVDICREGAKAVVFSVEDSVQDKTTKMLSTLTDIPVRQLVRGRLNEYEAYEIEKATEILKDFFITIYDDCYTLDEMELKIKKHTMQGGVDIVAIDFVQNIITGGESIYDRMSEVAIRLQRMAKKYDVCILALSQVSSEEKGKISLRGAQELASAADMVLWIDRKPDIREFDLIIRKNRPFGYTGKIPFTFTEKWTGVREQ